jgi:hypothetical protein
VRYFSSRAGARDLLEARKDVEPANRPPQWAIETPCMFVIPLKLAPDLIGGGESRTTQIHWIPAFAGMTNKPML